MIENKGKNASYITYYILLDSRGSVHKVLFWPVEGAKSDLKEREEC